MKQEQKCIIIGIIQVQNNEISFQCYMVKQIAIIDKYKPSARNPNEKPVFINETKETKEHRTLGQ